MEGQSARVVEGKVEDHHRGAHQWYKTYRMKETSNSQSSGDLDPILHISKTSDREGIGWSSIIIVF